MPGAAKKADSACSQKRAREDDNDGPPVQMSKRKKAPQGHKPGHVCTSLLVCSSYCSSTYLLFVVHTDHL